MTVDLAAFILARLSEREAVAQQVRADLTRTHSVLSYDVREENGDTTIIRKLRIYEPDEVLAEVAAKRRIVDWCTLPDRGGGPDISEQQDDVLRLLALPYAEHEAYREEWRPVTWRPVTVQ